MTTTQTKGPGKDAKYYVGKIDTTWHVYPQEQKEEIIAVDWYGFWALSEHGYWFKSPVSYVCVREISKQEAEANRG